ncbi:peripheral-type benzodiazepine receptor-associated protein 1 isoform X3 [Acipenser ruthenus]|uniref:peripheral-type benzodiazepine receptor-associated protein 1 isoform X3 n=1 Tax=Acipenser ruthenus TaxID=7906 RepID=UPI0027406E62|nr:peripheral-type benzodiazepine receptor-associated protein 1 isoform X3 [Acipenser ruthenus]
MGKDRSNSFNISPKKDTSGILGEYRKEIEKLKTALENEKCKNKQARKKFATDLNRFRAAAKKEQTKVVEDLSSRHEQQKALEVRNLKEAFAKERETEIRQLLRWKGNELKEVGVSLGKERDIAIKHARELQRQLAEELVSKGSPCKVVGKKATNDPGCLSNRVAYRKLEQLLLKLRWETDGEQAALIRRLKAELDLEKNLFLKHLLETHSWSFEENKAIRRRSSGESSNSLAFVPGSPECSSRATRTKSVSLLEEEEKKKPSKRDSGTSASRGSFCSSPGKESFCNNLSPEKCTSTPRSLRWTPRDDQVFFRRSCSTGAVTSGGPSPSKCLLFDMDWMNGTDYGYLVRQNSELLRALDELERTCASLRQENVLLRKSSSPETEEKVKRLKRKNAELAVIAKRLEERARKLQEANLKVANTPVPLKGSSAEQYKKAFARQRAHDLAEQAETLLAKDKEIEALRVECRELQSRFGKGKGAPGQSGGGDFERLLRESQKEVLRLQRQLALSSTREPEVVNSQGKAKTENALVHEEPQTGRFEKTNGCEKHKPSLTPEHPALEQEDQRLQQLETELCKKRKECESLEHEVRKRQKRCQDLESELNDVRGRNARLKEETGHLIQKAELLDQVQSENDELRDNLSAVTAQRNSALEENQRLQAKLDNLEQVLKQMREVAERRQHLESEHEEALNVLRLKQDEVQRLQKAQVEAKREHEGVVQLLEDLIQLVYRTEMVKVRELEGKCRSQSEQFALLCHELERFRLQAGKISVLNSEPENTVSAELDLQPKLTLYNGVEVPEEKDSCGSWTVISLGDVSLTSLELDSSFFSEISSQEVEAAPLSAPASPAAETPKEEPVSEEVSVQHIESTAVSTESAEEPTPTTPKSESQQVTPKSESFQHSTPKSCPTPEVDTASEVEELDIDVSPIPEPESGAPAKLQVFIARYSYNPFDGPNENPEAELPLTAGEYIYACGDMDEDGFYEGELMDGRRGLVPSNFVERVSDDDMMSFHPPEVSDLSHNSYQESSFHSSSEKNLRLSVNSSDKTELSVPEEEEEMGQSLGKAGSLMANGYDLDMEEVGDDIVPYPRRLTLIKQLAKSIIISWDSPLVPAGWGNVWSYNVYVDKELRLNVPFGSQTKAVLERLDVNLKTYRISVQSLTEKGNSDLLQCSFLVGRNVCVAPTQLKVENVTATSANLTWLPSNSNYVHAVSLNEEEYEVVKAGCYSYCLSNLRPNMRYKVKVEARPLQTPWELPLERWERKCTVTAFTTLMAGPPDAPLDIQVESGPSPGIVLVSWLPVTIDAAGTSNGVRVTGYAVYADTQKVLEVASPTAGSVLVGPSQIHFLQVAKELTIRTMSPYGESVDSVPVKIPSQLFRPTAHCQPLQMLPSASSTSDVCVHTVPPYRDALENTTAKTPALLTAMLQFSPLGATPNSEAAELHDLSSNTSVLCKEDRTLHINARTDPLLDATSVSNTIADGDLMSAARSAFHEADIPEEDLTKDSENSSVKRPTATIADFLEEAEWTEAADSSAADVAVDRSDSLLTDEASADTAALVGSPIQTLEAVELEQEAEEESSRGKVRLVSVEEFLDDTQEESELRCKPEQEESRLKGPEKEKEECLELPEPRRDHRLNEYRAESSRGSDLSDILEEDEEELCSDTAVNEEGEEPASGHSIGEAGKSDMWETDSDEEILEKILELPLQTHHSKQLFSILEVTEEEDESQELEEGEQQSSAEVPGHGLEERASFPETYNCANKLSANPSFPGEDCITHSEVCDTKSIKASDEATHFNHKPHRTRERSSQLLSQTCENEAQDHVRYSTSHGRNKLHTHKDHHSTSLEAGSKTCKFPEENFDSEGSIYIQDRVRRAHNREQKGTHFLKESADKTLGCSPRMRQEALLMSQRDIISSELLKTKLAQNKYYNTKGSRRNTLSSANGIEIDIEYGTEDDEDTLPCGPAVVHLGQMRADWCGDGPESEGCEELSDCSSQCDSVQSNGPKRELKRQHVVDDDVFVSGAKLPHHHHRSRGTSGTLSPHSRGKGGTEAGETRRLDLQKTAGRRAKPEHGAKGHPADDSYARETVANGDPRLQHSAEVLGKTGRAETRPAKEALRTGNPGITEGSEAEGIIQDNAVRIFVALFAYDPASMSPNPDAAEEELPFKEGQIIKIHGDKDADGFYHGESRGRFGYVPCNMVSEIQVEDEQTRDQLLQQGYLSAEASVEKIGTRSHAQLPRRPIPPPKPRRSKKECSRPSSGSQRMTRPRRMVAVFDYDPRESSPNVDIEAELTFSAGDVIVVFGDMDDDGFFYGDLNGQQGLAPSNFLQALPENGEEAAGGLSEEKVLPAESRRESQVSLEGSEEQNDSAVTSFEEPLTPCPTVGITAPPQVQVPSPESPGQSDTSPPGKKKRGFFSKGKKLFKKLGSSKKE